MPIEINWLSDEENIVLVRYLDPWTWDELQDAVRAYNQMGAGRERVWGLHDFSEAPEPPGGSIINSLQEGAVMLDHNVRLLVGVGVPRLSRVFTEIVMRVFRFEVAWAASREEALALIRERIAQQN